jgi:predicted aldo/keto reductase-like oxidoreductase
VETGNINNRKIPVLGFGMMRLPLTNPEDYSSVDFELSTNMIDRFLESGFTYFDTAYPYHQGKSEAVVKKALSSRYSRDTFTLADKMPVWLVKEPGDYQKYFDEQLKRCGVEYFDYNLLHNLGAKAYADTLKYGGFELLKKIMVEGKARYVGFSFHNKAAVLENMLAEQCDIDFVQLQINYADWNSEIIQSHKCYETAVKYQKPVIVMEPIKGGSLAPMPEILGVPIAESYGRPSLPKEAEQLFKIHNPAASAVSWAIRFPASLPGIITILSGMNSLEQLRENAALMNNFKSLDAGEQEVIKKVTEIINRNIAIPCTACAYCVEGCPQRIPIPQYFSIYNDQKQFGLTPPQTTYYNNLAHEFSRASDCVSCKQCEEHCPQHIAISERLKEVAGAFDITG